jgi:hypothetical protein
LQAGLRQPIEHRGDQSGSANVRVGHNEGAPATQFGQVLQSIIAVNDGGGAKEPHGLMLYHGFVDRTEDASCLKRRARQPQLPQPTIRTSSEVSLAVCA